jgi:mannose-6-phosphate isomerase-like protein (cupin superfamily)
MSEQNKNSQTQFISGPTIPVMEVVHDDGRRTIREAELHSPGSPMRRVTSIAVKAAAEGQTMDLGNHYHSKPEYFSVLAGNPEVTTAHTDSPEDVTVRRLGPGDTVTMQPGEAHKFSFSGPGELRSTMDGTFEQSGTKPHQL